MDKLLTNLEYDKILDIIASYTVSEKTKTEIYDLIYPKDDLNSTQVLLDECEEAYNLYHIENIKPLTTFNDATAPILKSKVSAMLSLAEIRRVYFLLRAGRIAKNSITQAPKTNLLRNYVQRFVGDANLEKDIESWIISDTEISDNASSKLKEIRRKLITAKSKLSNKVKKYSRSSDVSKYLQDDLVTMREGRYVLPVKSEYRTSVPGLVHDRSATGATLFIEPYTIVESNNEIKSLEIEQNQEIERIIKLLTDRIATTANDLEVMQEALVRLDAVFSKAHFSANYNCTKPMLNNKGVINLIQSRHPLIDSAQVVPVSLEIGKDYKILTITGPNTGGKTVALKTVGLFCLMAASGIFLPVASDSQIAVFDQVYSVIGDEQSITSSLSTFSSHIKNLVGVLDNVTKNSLVLLDELGGGTDPDEGAALAIGIIKYLEQVGCSGIVTTHFGQLKEYAVQSKHIQNASMQFDNVSLRPTYRLISGLPGASNAIKIAKTLGINEFVINAAYDSLPEEKKNFENLLANAEKVKNQALSELESIKIERKEVAKLKAEIESDRQELKERLERVRTSAKSEIRRMVSNSMDTADELIQQIKEQIEKADETALLESRRLMKKLKHIKYENEETPISKSYQPINPKSLKKGMNIFIISLETTGIIMKLNPQKKEATVQAGAYVSNINYKNLALPPSPPVQNKTSYKIDKSLDSTNTEIREINIIGKTVAEASYEIDVILSTMQKAQTLRIVHGKGTGALGRGVQAYLRNNKEVKSLRYGKYGEGDTGVTVVELK